MESPTGAVAGQQCCTHVLPGTVANIVFDLPSRLGDHGGSGGHRPETQVDVFVEQEVLLIETTQS